MSEASTRAKMKHMAKTYDRFEIKDRKERKLKERLQVVADRLGTTPTEYMRDAIYSRLEQDEKAGQH